MKYKPNENIKKIMKYCLEINSKTFTLKYALLLRTLNFI